MSESTQTHQLDITRVFDAPREIVFRCMIEPEHLTHFWGPVGMSTPLASITIEPWAGGRFETIMVNDETGEEYPNRGVFVEVIEPEKLVWTDRYSLAETKRALHDNGSRHVIPPERCYS